MDVGTVLDGESAVSEGLIDNIGSLSDALTCLYDMIENNPKPKRSDKYKQEENNNEEEPDL